MTPPRPNEMREAMDRWWDARRDFAAPSTCFAAGWDAACAALAAWATNNAEAWRMSNTQPLEAGPTAYVMAFHSVAAHARSLSTTTLSHNYLCASRAGKPCTCGADQRTTRLAETKEGK